MGVVVVKYGEEISAEDTALCDVSLSEHSDLVWLSQFVGYYCNKSRAELKSVNHQRILTYVLFFSRCEMLLLI